MTRLIFSFLCVLSVVSCGGNSQTSDINGKTRLLATSAAAPGAYTSVVQQLYVAYFGRPADPVGLANFEAALIAAGAPANIHELTAAYNSSAAIKTLIDSFGTSSESNALYAGDTTAFVKAVFNSVLNRPPAAQGLEFWANAIDSGVLTRGNAALSIMAGALANTTTQGVIDAATVNNKIAIASGFTLSLTSDAQINAYKGSVAAATARSMLQSVTESTDTAGFAPTILSTIETITAISESTITFDIAIAASKQFLVDDEVSKLSISNVRNGIQTVTPISVSWISNKQGALSGNATSLGEALEAGTHQITVVVDGGAAGKAGKSVSVLVLPRMTPVTDFQQTPAAGYKYLVPIVLISYIPTEDGINIPASFTERDAEFASGKISDVKTFISSITSRAKFMLEEGSKFRGYKDPSAKPSLGYKVVAHYNVYEWMKQASPDRADLFDVMSRMPSQDLIENQGVKEVWLWGHPYAGLFESNMSSPTTGDISNSYRENDDLPVFNKTYVVYGYNYGRTHNEAVHNHGHQHEAIFDYVSDLVGDGSELFWKEFVGMDDQWRFKPGRCGSTHFALNSVQDYEYGNVANKVVSSCEDWRPDGSGATKNVDAYTWANLQYSWPVEAWPNNNQANPPFEANWYIYWMQNMPGSSNNIPYKNTTMEDWWIFVADWDAAINSGKRLYK